MLKQTGLKVAHGSSWTSPTFAVGVLALRLGRAWSLGLLLAAATGLGGTAAWAGCNSGSKPSTNLLSSSQCQSFAPGKNSLAVGQDARALGDSSVAIGVGTGDFANKVEGVVAIGFSTNSYNGIGAFSTAVGYEASAKGENAVAVGGGEFSEDKYTRADGINSVAVGHGAWSLGNNSVSLGELAGQGQDVKSSYNTALGGEAGSFVEGDGNTAAGLAAGYLVTGDFNSALGNSAGQQVTGERNLAAGVLSGRPVKGSQNAAFGDTAGSGVSGDRNIAVGSHAGTNITAKNTISIGTRAAAKADDAITLGSSAEATARGAVAIGNGSVADAANTVSIGNDHRRRRVVNLAAGVNGTDAVNLAQVKFLLTKQAEIIASQGHKIDELRAALHTLEARVSGQQVVQ